MVLLSSRHKKSRPIKSDFSIVSAIYHQMVTIIYLPMQKFEKMFERISGVVIAPVISPMCVNVVRRSAAIRSVGSPLSMESIMLDSDSLECSSDS